MMPSPNRKNAKFIVSAPPDLLEEFDRYLKAEKYTRSELVRDLMRRYIAEKKAQVYRMEIKNEKPKKT